jgi:phosphoribosylaminoimidazole-succinocarboxamide synthase
MTEGTILYTDLKDLPLQNRGKVRDIYDLGETLLLIATDRISAFDVVLSEGIPTKGEILTQISRFWFEKVEDIIANHLLSTDVGEFPDTCASYRDVLGGRTMWVKKASPLPLECVVRGYLSGSGWREYRETGSVCGIALPQDLKESAQLAEPVFTPATKAERGLHDENISMDVAREIIGGELACRVKALSIEIYERARACAEKRGIIIADTKFEFGLYEGELMLIDELLTPDSSRFWAVDDYEPGRPQRSFDKQFVRDYLSTLDWDKNPPPPPLPDEIVAKTREKYLEAYRRLTGKADL